MYYLALKREICLVVTGMKCGAGVNKKRRAAFLKQPCLCWCVKKKLFGFFKIILVWSRSILIIVNNKVLTGGKFFL